MVTVTDRRAFGSILLASYLPCAYRTDPKRGLAPSAADAVSFESFEEITNGVWRPRPKIGPVESSGTTCGFLPSWFLWRLGCKDRNLVNRSCTAADGTPIGRYANAQNICAIRGACGRDEDPNRRRHGYYVPISGHAANTRAFAAGTLRPKLGDIIHINTTLGTNQDHVFIFLNRFEEPAGTERWETAEAGGPTPEYAGQQMKAPFWREQAVFSRKRTVGRAAGSIQLLQSEPGSAAGTSPKHLMGWVDLDRITNWGPFVLDAGRHSAVPGYPPPVKLPSGQTIPWSTLAAGSGMLEAILPGIGIGIGTGGGPAAPPTPPPPQPGTPGTITLPGGFNIPDPFGIF